MHYNSKDHLFREDAGPTGDGGAANVLADESKIVAELKQMLVDRGSPTALAAHRQQLVNDLTAMQTPQA